MDWKSVELHWNEIAERLRRRWRQARAGHASAREPAPHLDANLLRAYGLERDETAKNAEDYCRSR